MARTAARGGRPHADADAARPTTVRHARANRRVERGTARSRPDVRQGHLGALLGHAARRGPARAPAGRRPTSATRICGAGVRPPCQRFCPANVYEIVREESGAAAPADQRVELRALQDVRHHGPLPGDHLGAARRRRRTAVRRPVTTPHETDWKASRSKRLQASAIGAIGYPTIRLLGPLVAVACRGPRAFRHGARGGPLPGDGVLARAHPAGALLLPPPRHRRHHQRQLRRRVDCEDHPPVRVHHRPGLDIAQRGARRAEGEAPDGGGPRRRSHVDGPRGPALVAQPGAVWLAKATGNPSCRFTSKRRRTGPRGAGMPRRSPGRSAASRSSSASRSSCQPTQTTRHSRRTAGSSKSA